MKNQKILAAMSGGVDSSACALLLKEQGYEVCGATMQLYTAADIGRSGAEPLANETDAGDAAKVCRLLGIEHHILDMRSDFFKNVITPFAQEYERGRTPNPCIECNRTMKFNGLLQRAIELGCDKIATGHYVQSEYDEASERWILKKAVCEEKDQSYVLYSLGQQQLARSLFPLGALTKQEVREIAEKHGLATAQKRESQDICFVPDGDYAAFLTGVLGVKSAAGSFVSTDGKILGNHKGQIHYTIGQRKGLGISAASRIFVLKKRLAENSIVLGDEKLLYSKQMTVRNDNWVSIKRPECSIRAQVKARYRQRAVNAWLHPGEGFVTVEFDEPQRAVTSGQAAVFYDGDVLLGGATIE